MNTNRNIQQRHYPEFLEVYELRKVENRMITIKRCHTNTQRIRTNVQILLLLANSTYRKTNFYRQFVERLQIHVTGRRG